MSVVRCPVAGTYLVRDEDAPLPFGKTPSDVSVIVHRYRYGWVCGEDGIADQTTIGECTHVRAAQESSLGLRP